MIDLLAHARELTGDPALGLRAAEHVDPGDLGALEPLVQTCRTLREGMRQSARYVALLNEAARVTVEEGDDVVVWRWEIVDGIAQPAPANDFIVATFLRSWQRHTGLDESPIEVHFAHPDTDAREDYARIFRCPVKLGMPHNALLLRRSFVHAPMAHANRSLNLAFERHAQSLLVRLRRHDSASNRTRAIIFAELQSGDPSMESIARKLGMSTATLRRRLDDEGTTHRQILDEVRSGLAKRYLREGKLAIREVSAMLGFAHVTAFYKAFRRWSGGGTPASFRGRTQRFFPRPRRIQHQRLSKQIPPLSPHRQDNSSDVPHPQTPPSSRSHQKNRPNLQVLSDFLRQTCHCDGL
jgi:AraC-like DNA-binding protein